MRLHHVFGHNFVAELASRDSRALIGLMRSYVLRRIHIAAKAAGSDFRTALQMEIVVVLRELDITEVTLYAIGTALFVHEKLR